MPSLVVKRSGLVDGCNEIKGKIVRKSIRITVESKLSWHLLIKTAMSIRIIGLVINSHIKNKQPIGLAIAFKTLQIDGNCFGWIISKTGYTLRIVQINTLDKRNIPESIIQLGRIKIVSGQ